MKEKEKLNSIDLIDEKFIEEAAPYNAKPFRKFSRKRLIRIAIAAASLCLLTAILVSVIIGALQKKKPKEPELVSGPIYNYEEFDELVNYYPYGYPAGIPTNQYTRTTVTSLDALRESSLPFDEPALIYDYIKVRKELDKDELKSFTDPIVERYCKMVNAPVPEYGFWRQTRYDGEKVIRNDIETNEIGSRTFSVYQYEDMYRISFYVSGLRYTIEDCKLALDGISIQADQRKSDEALKQDLEPIKEKLFELFGVEFSDVNILRSYNEYDKTKLDHLYVTFYNNADHELNDNISPLSDSITLSFDNTKHSSIDTTSDTILYNVSISYKKYRSEPYERCYATKKVELLDLKIAEEYLSKGYVIGGYGCPICTASQEKIDFEDYDIVCIRYRVCKDVVIPFYNFYKHIEGNTYAMTSVPAIEISGYAEHFEKAAAEHDHKMQ